MSTMPDAEFRTTRRNRIWHEHGGRCVYCGLEAPDEEQTLDHIVPRSKGGTSSQDNLRPCCRNCNTKKADRTLDEFRAHCARERRFLPKHHPNRSGPYLFAFERQMDESR